MSSSTPSEFDLTLIPSLKRLAMAVDVFFSGMPQALPLIAHEPSEEKISSIRFEIASITPRLICKLY
jgi:hypothetical protein